MINLKWLRDIFTVIFSFFAVCRTARRNNEVCIVADVLNSPIALGAYWASKFLRCTYTVSVTDDPKFCGCGKAYIKTSYHLINKSHAYIFITDQMNDRFNSKSKKSIVIEGLVDASDSESGTNTYEKTTDKFVIMYTGSIHKKYGIENLVEGYLKANIPNSELHIYGDGDYKDIIIEKSKEYDSIKYFGTVLSSEVVKRQKEATLLVNPRPIDEEYVYFSFPSKNMEYMVSATPVLTTDLPGMPKEYREYVYILDNYSPDGIKNKLLELSQLDRNDMADKGKRAREFVLEKKNNIVQGKKILDLIDIL